MSSTNQPNAGVVKSDNKTLVFPVPASLAIGIGDLMYWVSGSSVIKPLTSLSTGASEAVDQATIVPLFVGVAGQARLATDTVAGSIVVLTDAIIQMTCPSQTWEIGDLVGPTWAGGSALVDQQVTKVLTANLAIGVVTERAANAATTVRFRLISRRAADIATAAPNAGIGHSQGASSAVFPDADTTLTVASVPIQVGVPTAARKAILPAPAASKGLWFWFINNSAGSFAINVRDAGDTTTIAAVAQNKRGLAFCDGTTWFGLISA